jgi:hypothetical protein
MIPSKKDEIFPTFQKHLKLNNPNFLLSNCIFALKAFKLIKNVIGRSRSIRVLNFKMTILFNSLKVGFAPKIYRIYKWNFTEEF